MQIVIELFAIEDVLVAKARNQSGFLDVLHLVAQFAVLENLAAFEANFGNAHAWAFVDRESNRHRGG